HRSTADVFRLEYAGCHFRWAEGRCCCGCGWARGTDRVSLAVDPVWDHQRRSDVHSTAMGTARYSKYEACVRAVPDLIYYHKPDFFQLVAADGLPDPTNLFQRHGGD